MMYHMKFHRFHIVKNCVQKTNIYQMTLYYYDEQLYFRYGALIVLSYNVYDRICLLLLLLLTGS